MGRKKRGPRYAAIIPGWPVLVWGLGSTPKRAEEDMRVWAEQDDPLDSEFAVLPLTAGARRFLASGGEANDLRMVAGRIDRPEPE